MEALLNQHREHERDLRNTLVTAQRMSDDIRANADAQARQIVREAEGRSDLLLQKTQARLEDVQREIDGMKMKRREVENSLESTIASLRNTLEFVREQEQRERDEKILLHRPRAGRRRRRVRSLRAAESARRPDETPDRRSVDGAANDALVGFRDNPDGAHSRISRMRAARLDATLDSVSTSTFTLNSQG